MGDVWGEHTARFSLPVNGSRFYSRLVGMLAKAKAGSRLAFEPHLFRRGDVVFLVFEREGQKSGSIDFTLSPTGQGGIIVRARCPEPQFGDCLEDLVAWSIDSLDGKRLPCVETDAPPAGIEERGAGGEQKTSRRERLPEKRRRARLWRIIKAWAELTPDEIGGRLAQYASQHSSEAVWQPEDRDTLLKVIAEGKQGKLDNVA